MYKSMRHPIAIKQKEYSEEKEYRMIFGWPNYYVNEILKNKKNETPPSEIFLHFSYPDFNEVFNEIWISPNHSNIVKEVVEKLKETHSLSAEIKNSKIIRSEN